MRLYLHALRVRERIPGLATMDAAAGRRQQLLHYATAPTRALVDGRKLGKRERSVSASRVSRVASEEVAVGPADSDVGVAGQERDTDLSTEFFTLGNYMLSSFTRQKN